MKTDELIRMMAEDAPVKRGLTRQMASALLAGTGLSALLLLATVGIRPDMASAIETGRVMFKIGLTTLFAVLACRAVFEIGRPDATPRHRLRLLALPLITLIVGVVSELALVPGGEWMRRMTGGHPTFCLFFIPVLSLAPLMAFLLALKNAAPAKPGLAGAVAGASSAGLASALYAWHCPDDSPLFMAVWYSLAIVMVTVAGYFSGRRLLAW